MNKIDTSEITTISISGYFHPDIREGDIVILTFSGKFFNVDIQVVVLKIFPDNIYLLNPCWESAQLTVPLGDKTNGFLFNSNKIAVGSSVQPLFATGR